MVDGELDIEDAFTNRIILKPDPTDQIIQSKAEVDEWLS